MGIFSDKRFRIIAILSVSVTLVGCALVVWLAQSRGLDPISLTGDSKGYIYLAENLVKYQVFSVAQSEPLYPESFRAPGYPAFLALLFAIFGVSVMALFAHAFVASAAPVLLYLLLRGWHERAAFWAAIIFTFEPVRVYLSSSFLSDAFFAVIFLTSLLCLVRVRNLFVAAVLAGVLLGAAILVRPIAIFLPLVYALYVLATIRPWKRGLVTALLLCLVSGATILPWMYRNHIHFDSWAISSVGTANLMLYNAPEFLKWHSDPHASATLEVFRAEQNTLPREEALSLSRSTVFTDAFREIIRGNEVSYVFFHVVKTAPFFLTDGLRDTIRLFGIDVGGMPNISTALMRGDLALVVAYIGGGGLAIVLFLVGTGFWASVTVLFGLETMRALSRREWFTILFLAVLTMYFALLTGPVSNARYRLPVEGFLLFGAISMIIWWYDRSHEAREY